MNRHTRRQASTDPAAEQAAGAGAGAVRWSSVPRRGVAKPGRGWVGAWPAVPAWRMTSDQAPVLWPFVTAPPLPAGGALLGWDLASGGLFHADPVGWVLDPKIPVANPNVFVFGKPGRGKSATVKAMVLRLVDCGYQALILGDAKDEYTPLCRALGVEPVEIGPGLPGRINPLDYAPGTDTGTDAGTGHSSDRRSWDATVARWTGLVGSLVGSIRQAHQRVPFGPTENTVVSHVLRDLTGSHSGATHPAPVTIPLLWQALADPTRDLVQACRYASVRDFLDQTRLLRDALGQLVSGSLAGLFDAPSTVRLDPAAPIQSLSLARLSTAGDDAVGIALLCLGAWGSAHRGLPGGHRAPRVVVRDEAWKQLRLGVDAVASFDADLRLSRSTGDIQIAVAHKPSDLLTAGDTGSQAVAIARDLLHLADIRVLHGQDPATADDLDQLLGLGPTARSVVTGWAMHGTGRALWCVGPRHHQVQTVLHPDERHLTDTNTALDPRTGP